MHGYSHRVSAAALRSRGLLRISGRGSTWRAELTDSGRAVVAELDEPKVSTHTDGLTKTETSVTTAAQPSTDEASPTPSRSSSLLKTEQLIDDVLAAGGTLLLPDETAGGGVNWRQRAYAAQRHGKVPDGKHLSVSWTSAGFEISLRDGETGNELGADAVPVPVRVHRYHPAVQQFRDRTSLHEVSRKAAPRALRIMHALATELDRRGHRIRCAEALKRDDSYGGYRRKPADDGHFVVTINAHDFALRLSEKGVGLRGPWEAQKQRREESRRALRFDPWDVGRIEPYDKGATGQLDLAILTYGPRQSKWGDRKRWSLEDRLPQVMRELETLAEEAEQRRLAREREDADRQRAWEAAMATAKERAIEHHHVEVLNRRVANWKDADEIRAYCDAVERRYAELRASDPAAESWLRFARDYADRLQRPPRMPADPELKHEDLKPFLGGWSPYGPDRGRW